MNKKDFNEIWNKAFGKEKDEKTHAIAMLIIYFIFILIVIVFIKTSPSTDTSNNANTTKHESKAWNI